MIYPSVTVLPNAPTLLSKYLILINAIRFIMRLKIYWEHFKLLAWFGISLIFGGTGGGIWLNPLLWILIVFGLFIIISCLGIILHDMKKAEWDDFDRIIVK